MQSNNTSLEPKSSWAYIIILFVIISFGLFWLSQYQRVKALPPIVTTSVPQKNMDYTTTDLEASVLDIQIPEYEEEI